MAKMGRKPKMTDEKVEQFKALCRLKPSLRDAGFYLNVDPDTIVKWCRRTHKQTFSEFREDHMAHTRFALVRDLIAQSKRGNTKATIFALEKLGGPEWKPDLPMGGDGDNGTWTLNYSIPAKAEQKPE